MGDGAAGAPVGNRPSRQSAAQHSGSLSGKARLVFGAWSAMLWYRRLWSIAP